MNIRGNPFVDVGLAIAANINDHKSLSDITAADVSNAVRILYSNIDELGSLKGILSAFWVNNPFMGKNLGQKDKFDRYLRDLGNEQLPVKPGYCQICGGSPVVGNTDRCWFPLSASADSDPCTLPSLRGKAVCATCLSAVVILPLGCRFCREGPYFIHVAEPDLQVDAVSEGIAAVRTALATKSDGSLRHSTSLTGRLALLEIVSGSMLWDHTQPDHMRRIPQMGATAVAFNNKGTGPVFDELHLPAQALEFFGAIFEAGVQKLFLEWVRETQEFARKTKNRNPIDKLCDDVESRRSLAPVLLTMRADGRLRQEEKQVLKIYEDVALRKKERFDTLERLATRIKEMDDRYRESFIKQLGNIGSKDRFLELVKKFSKSKKLSLTSADLRVIDYGPSNEVIALLYLLCITEEQKGVEL